MFDVAVKLDRAMLRLGRLPDDVRTALRAEVDDLATALRDRSKEKFEEFFVSRTGDFLKSIKKSVRTTKTSVVGKVYTKSRVGHLLERGVKPHDIKPKNAKALALAGIGTGRFAEIVHHPGFAGHTIINAAFQEMRAQIRDGIEQSVRLAAKNSGEAI